MKSVIVTGGSGKAGRAAIRELLAHGYQVMNVDTVAPAEQLCHFIHPGRSSCDKPPREIDRLEVRLEIP